MNLPATSIRIPESPTRPSRRRRFLLWIMLAWTVLVGLAVWWLLQTNPAPPVLIINSPDPKHPAGSERLRGFFKTNLGLQRVYPWILFGPYVALVATYCPLERGRLRLSLPVNLGAFVAFLSMCHAINAHTRVMFENITIVRFDTHAEGHGTNAEPPDILTATPAGPFPEISTNARGYHPPVEIALARIIASNGPDVPNTALTNLTLPFGQDSPPSPPLPHPSNSSLWQTLVDILAYGAIAGLAHSIHFYGRYREREHRAVILESSLANAKLSALTAQLQPHFLFNSLNAIVALLRRDPRLAETTLLSLSELLRLALSQSDKQEIPLRDELHFVQRYLEIQQTRFGDKLRVEQDIEPATLDCLVPTLLLQPLVENAIRHGIEPADFAGVVRLTARRQAENLLLTVDDNGIGLGTTHVPLREPKAEHPGKFAPSPVAPTASLPPSIATGSRPGIGLANLRARLEALYGPNQALAIVPRPEGGVSVRIEIPGRLSPATSSIHSISS